MEIKTLSEDLSTMKIHQRKSGETIFYPNKYNTYEDFIYEHVTNLLAERLFMFCKLKLLYDDRRTLDSEKMRTNFLYQTSNIQRNYIVLVNNLCEEEMVFIFKDKPNHFVNIALALKKDF